MTRDVSAGIEQAYLERTDLLVVALTGRTGSGCTTVANVFAKNFSEIVVSESDQPKPEDRKLSICKSFLEKNWTPFKPISVSTLIFSHLIESTEEQITEFFKNHRIEQNDLLEINKELNKIKTSSEYKYFYEYISGNQNEPPSDIWKFYLNTLSPAASRIRSLLGSNYITIFQKIGDNIRLSGNAISETINQNKIFSLMRQIKRLIDGISIYDRLNSKPSTRIIIDAIRNPLELLYLRDQFPVFYAIAITADDDQRIARLEAQSYTKKEIQKIDNKEASGKKSLKDYESFVSQNIQECIQKSDIFLANSGMPKEFAGNIRGVNAQVLRYTALMLRPGIVTPTRDERCMQLAFVAKVNSGCISRQVGAAVADEAGSIKSVGWNDVPKGQIPCLLRDVNDLISGGDPVAFSYYEKTETKLRKHIENKFSQRNSLKSKTGLPCPYCFKDAINAINDDENNQVHTRSLHAEENAFLQLAKHGNSGILGGVLYTTASPCELCSKKAFQLGMREIIYVDPYPGISSTHVLRSGEETMIPKLRLFNGAIGHAYHRLYEPILPIKDEYLARLNDDPQQKLI